MQAFCPKDLDLLLLLLLLLLLSSCRGGVPADAEIKTDPPAPPPPSPLPPGGSPGLSKVPCFRVSPYIVALHASPVARQDLCTYLVGYLISFCFSSSFDFFFSPPNVSDLR